MKGRKEKMKTTRIMLGALLALSTSLTTIAGIVGMDDIEYWVGSGANSAALVIDFNDGRTSESYVWGYRWDGTACGADMLIAIAAADANLTLDYEGDGTDSFLLNSVSYYSQTQTKAADWSVFWNYYVAGGYASDDIPSNDTVDTPAAVASGGTTLPETWTSSPVGASSVSFGDSGRILSDGSWDAWSFGAWGTTPGTDIEAVPEPASALLLMLGSLGIVGFRRYKKHLGF
jgi:hypothetical protein